jgi:hypothetical protein
MDQIKVLLLNGICPSSWTFFDLFLQSMQNLVAAVSEAVAPTRTLPPSIASVFSTLTVCNSLTPHITSYSFHPYVNKPRVGLFDPNLSALAVFKLAAICGGVCVYAVLDSMYHVSTLIGRLILRQAASVWPPTHTDLGCPLL